MFNSNYFKGWYFKCFAKDQTMAFIPACHRTGRKETASLQIIMDEAAFHIPFQSLSFREHPLCVNVSIADYEKSLHIFKQMPPFEPSVFKGKHLFFIAFKTAFSIFASLIHGENSLAISGLSVGSGSLFGLRIAEGRPQSSWRSAVQNMPKKKIKKTFHFLENCDTINTYVYVCPPVCCRGLLI